MRDLASGEIIFMNPPKPCTARGLRMVADAVAGEKTFHVLVRDLRFQALDIETGIRPIDACGELFPLDLETGAGHWKRTGSGYCYSA